MVQVQVRAPRPPVEKYGDWSVDRSESYLYAYTNNGSGSVFGILCGRTCSVYFNPQVSCEDAVKTPVLFNTPAGAFTATLRCLRTKDRALLAADFPELLVDAMEIGGELGIAFPMDKGQFRVARFSLTGALKAAIRAFNLSEAGRDESGESGLRDQTL